MKAFVVTPEHLKLIRAMNFRYEDGIEFGAPAVDPKRPYGNSWVLGDIAEILDEPLQEDEWGDTYASDEQTDRFVRLHKETTTALEIAIRVGYFKAGTYEADDYMRNWREVD